MENSLIRIECLSIELCQTVKSVALHNLRLEKEYLWSVLAKAPTDLDLELVNC